jgi:hypothetical protein
LPDDLDEGLVQVARAIGETPSRVMRDAIAAAVRFYRRRFEASTFACEVDSQLTARRIDIREKSRRP